MLKDSIRPSLTCSRVYPIYHCAVIIHNEVKILNFLSSIMARANLVI